MTAQRKKKILLAITCYNCEKQIGRVLKGLTPAILGELEMVLVIDNRSKDSSVEAALAAAARLKSPKVQVVVNDDNYGLGGSHKAAFGYAMSKGMDYVAILHGDNQATTGELKNLIKLIKANPDFGAVLGSRFMLASRLRGYSPLRTWGNRGLNALYTLVSLRATKDLGSGLNVFRLEDLKDKRYLSFSDGFTFNIDLLLDYFHKGSQIRYVPITWSETDQVSNARTFKVGWTALKTLLRWKAGRPSRIRPRSAYTFQRQS
jgi:glycosyltransferase involved in cell wall biosynthesis